MCDLLWSDPAVNGIREWGENDRGSGVLFGPVAVKTFLKKNKMKLIIRAHQMVENGYELLFNNTVLTIFSCPNYTRTFNNAAGLLLIDQNGSMKLIQMQPL